MNITVVTGHLSRPPERRVLPSGAELVSYDLTVEGPDGRAEAVPVVWPSAPAAADAFVAGDALVVAGRVRRRFFRAGGATQSRTEVVAEKVVPARRKAAARRLVVGAVEALAGGGATASAASGAARRGRAAQDEEAS